MITYYLVNLDYQTIWQGFFNREVIKAEIVRYLKSNPDQELTLEKDNSDPKTYGNDIIDTYCSYCSEVCKIVTKGCNTYYQPLTITTP